MRSFNQIPNKNFFLNYPPQSDNVPLIASHYMDMFDLSRAESSNIGKRQYQPSEFAFPEEIHKKLKVSSVSHQTKPQATMQNLSELLFQQNLPYDALLNRSAPLMNEQFQEELERLKQIQNLHFLMNARGQTEQFNHFMPQNFSNTNSNMMRSIHRKSQDLNMKSLVKEEYSKQEETISVNKWESLCTTDKLTETDSKSEINAATDACSETEPQRTHFQDIEEPALFEFTREFPDWDLITMFRFLRGSKARDVFEKDREFKIEKKIRKRKNVARRKERVLSTKPKTTKGKKKTATTNASKQSKAVKGKSTA